LHPAPSFSLNSTGVRQHLLDAVALDLAGRERLPPYHDRLLAQHDLDIVPGDVAAVEHAIVAQLALTYPGVALAEIVLAAGIHREIGGQRLPVLVEESQQPAPVVEVPVTHDEGVDLGRVDLQQFHVAVDHLGGPAIVKQERALVVAALRLQQQRQAPFAVQRARGVRGTAGLGLHPVYLLRLEEEVAGAVHQHPDTELGVQYYSVRSAIKSTETEASGCLLTAPCYPWQQWR